MKIVNRIPQSDGTVLRVWFDGEHLWQGNPPNLVGPFKAGDIHDQQQQENLVELDKTTIYPVK